MVVKKVESWFVESALHLKYRADRINNSRVFVFLGPSFGVDMASEKDVEDENIFKLNRANFAVEIGAGCDLTMMCDMRIASEKAIFAESFVKVGLIPGDGGAWFLPRVVGISRANEMAYTGEPVNAETALAWGMVSRVVAPDELLNAANELAARIAVNPPSALRMTKKLLKEGEHMQLPSILEMSATLQSLAHQTKDHAEAVDAIIEKRTPNFTGE